MINPFRFFRRSSFSTKPSAANPDFTHWHYSFSLNTTNLGDDVRWGTNPFTGEEVAFPIDDGLTEEEIEDVQEVFDAYQLQGPDPDGGGYELRGLDGESLTIPHLDLTSALPIVGFKVEMCVKQLSPDIAGMIMEVAQSGNMILSSWIGKQAVLPDRDPDARIAERWPDVKRIDSVAELHHWIEHTIGGSRGYGADVI